MYCAVDSDWQSEYWSDVLLDRDWSMLQQLYLSNYGITQIIIKSLMRPSVHLPT